MLREFRGGRKCFWLKGLGKALWRIFAPGLKSYLPETRQRRRREREVNVN